MAIAPRRIFAFFDGPLVGYFVGQSEVGTNVAEYVHASDVRRLLVALGSRPAKERQSYRDEYNSLCKALDLDVNGTKKAKL